MFGDVHKEPFNQWWESHKKIFMSLKYEGINENNPHINNHEIQYRTNLIPIANTISQDTYLRVNEIEKYLKVYVLRKKGLTMPEIIRCFYPKQKENAKNADIQRVFYNDLQRAGNIIKNVEDGYFPGDYQP